MPELPEVETMRRGIAPIAGAKIVRVSFPANGYRPIVIEPPPRQFSQQLRGKRIERIDRLGKRIVVRIDQDAAIVVEPRMTGLMLLANPPDQAHLRVAWHLADVAHQQLWFWDRRGLGTVRFMDSLRLEAELGDQRLGPDALEATGPLLRQRLGGSRREIKVALLDQRVIAGIGNLYASEILHVAQLSPRRRCNGLRSSEWERLVAAIHLVLEEAIHYEGSTLADGTYRNALNQRGSYQNHHRVYARAGHPCPRGCAGQIQRLVQAQRSTFWCPICQRGST